MKISVCCPSYKRPKVETLDYLPFCRVYVDKSEAEEYRKQNKGADIVECPYGVQGNLCRVRNYIINEELKENDVVVIIDDDLKGIFYHEKLKTEEVKTENFLKFIEKAIAK